MGYEIFLVKHCALPECDSRWLYRISHVDKLQIRTEDDVPGTELTVPEFSIHVELRVH